ncbi:MAG: M43 family zinc metalloprotease [Bacteroidia bacterium]|jgi:hypothetical protein|nr:M43 family zinc metalloprotease [Bacteroidia bacterium]GIV22800.1 MAG: hypothetical protein KatS3mg025_0459 [Bacteroidia bacterium]
MRGLWIGLLAGLWAQECGTAFLPQNTSPRTTALRKGRMRSIIPDTACHPNADFVVPVVFHVIYSGPQDSLPLSVIEEQMEQLFEDFRRIPYTGSYTPWGADMNVEFALATKDPTGQPTSGVVYWKYNQPPLNWTSPKLCLDDEAVMKAATGWPRDQYLNIWVVPIVCGFQGLCDTCTTTQVAGYAYYPWDAPTYYPTEFGTVVITRTVGRVGTLRRKGRVVTHELGHNLGLPHTFDQGCDNPSDCNGDGICDTPPTAQANYLFQQQNTCDVDWPDRPDDLRNVMDYTGDPHSHLPFTLGQSDVAYWALTDVSTYYPDLTSLSNLQATGTGPYGRVRAAVWAENTTGLVGTPIRFHAVAEGQPYLFSWNFYGGVPDNPASPCPVVTYPAPGIYPPPQLIVQNLSGRRDTAYFSNFIQIDTVRSLPYFEGFETGSYNMYISSGGLRHGFVRGWARWDTSAFPAGAYGASQYAMRLRLHNYPFYGERHHLITPAFDFRVPAGQRVRLTFAVSYACLTWSDSYSLPLTYVDTLRVWASPDGGGTWQLVYEKSGSDLSTHPSGCIVHSGTIDGAAYLPLHWRTDTVFLDAYQGVNGVRLRFEAIAGGGNNLYIDDVRVEAIPTGPTTSLGSAEASVSVYTTAEGAYLVSSKPQRASWRLYDGLGRVVAQGDVFLSAGVNPLPLPALSAGVYRLLVETPEGIQIRPYLRW